MHAFALRAPTDENFVFLIGKGILQCSIAYPDLHHIKDKNKRHEIGDREREAKKMRPKIGKRGRETVDRSLETDNIG